MRFQLIDGIQELVPGKRIQTFKNLTLGEDYLAEHFPTFPVMPGVLMLEAVVQSAAWLLRVTEDFAHSVIVLREAKGIKYGNFVEPGRQLRLTVELADKNTQGGKTALFKGNGEIDGLSAISGRFTLERYNLKERDATLEPLDEQMVRHYRQLYLTIGPNVAGRAAGA